jgi:1-acyl-sn-glycerol-3-phosphate acyltransferase
MRLRAGLAIAALAPATLVGIPAQWLALKFGSQLSLRFPVLFHRWVNLVLGIRRTVIGTPAVARPLLIAANHASWLDITVMSAIMPVSFVAKSEVAGWPLFGLFARLQRTVFVDRTRRSATGRTTAEMAQRLSTGDALVLFPEGTSNDGNRVYPFRSALLGAARDVIAGSGGLAVQPVSIIYTGIHGLPVGRFARARLAWYGDMDLGPHLLEILAMGAIDVTVVFGDPTVLDVAEDRKVLARQLEDQVRQSASQARTGRLVPPQ